MKNALVLVLTLASLALLAGCPDNSAKPGSTPAAGSATPAAASGAPSAAPSANKGGSGW